MIDALLSMIGKPKKNAMPWDEKKRGNIWIEMRKEYLLKTEEKKK